MLKKDSLFKGALVLSIGGFITKIIGAFYRIPLTNILGAEGIGIYQMVFPLYCLLLTVSSTGVPNGIAKLIAEGNNPESVLKTALKIFASLGVIATLLMMLFSGGISKLQGNGLAKNSYVLIAPSIFFVSVISCYRGCFQGFTNMKPTAISQVLEQLVKLIFGLSLTYIFRSNKPLSASLATLAVTISEIFACLYLIVCKVKRPLLNCGGNAIMPKSIIKTVFPITLSTLVMPLTRTVESFIIINILNKYLTCATARYGLYSGAIESLVGVPVSILYSIAVTAVPIISSSENTFSNKIKKIKKSVFLTAILSVICGALFFAFSKFIVSFLYKSLSSENMILTIKMARLSSLSIVFLPIMQTLASCLISISKLYVPAITSTISSIIKVFLTIILLKIKSINIFAVIISDIVCYLLACFLNIIYIKYILIKKTNLQGVK